MSIAYSHLGDVTDRNMMFGGVVLFAAAPTIAFILAIYAARAGHRSGKIAVVVSGLLLLATLVVLTLVYWWVGLPVTGVVAVLVLAWVLSRKIAVVVSGLLLLATLLVSAWLYGGWINVAVIAVTAVAAGLGFAWVRSRNKPPPGPDGARREVGPPAAGTPPGERLRPGAGGGMFTTSILAASTRPNASTKGQRRDAHSGPAGSRPPAGRGLSAPG
jgi:hypothetical protein